MSWYVDSSVIISSIMGEPKGDVFITLLSDNPVTSRLTQVEVLRKISKTDPGLLARAIDLLRQCTKINIDEMILVRAESYPSHITLKAADAIHLATAETISPMINGIATFDKQMAANAHKLNLAVLGVA